MNNNVSQDGPQILPKLVFVYQSNKEHECLIRYRRMKCLSSKQFSSFLLIDPIMQFSVKFFLSLGPGSPNCRCVESNVTACATRLGNEMIRVFNFRGEIKAT